MAHFLSLSQTKAQRFAGTYRIVPKVAWNDLLEAEFGVPDWVALYPFNVDKATLLPGTVLSPRMACKLFHDGVYLIAKAEEHPKFFQDRLPAMAHKCYKKKQWRKQFFEAARRVCCRLARGLGLHTNCLAEDAFVLMILADAFNLGWRRVGEFVDHLPETDKDRDWDRVARTAGNDDIASLLRGSDLPAPTSGGRGKNGANMSAAAKAGFDVRDVKGWFNMYDKDQKHCFDHIVRVHAEDMEGDADTASTFSAYSESWAGDDAMRSRSASFQSHVSHDGVLLAPPSPTTVTANSTAPGTPTALGQARKRAQVSAKPALEVLKEVPSSGDLAAALEKFVTLAP